MKKKTESIHKASEKALCFPSKRIDAGAIIMAASSASALVAFKTLFIVLMCIIAAALAYTLVKDGDSSCFDPSASWTQMAETDFFVFMFLIVAWFFYKESSWIKRVVFILLMLCFGSFVPCTYIITQFFKLSPEESSKDPLYYVIARHQNEDVMGHTSRAYVVTAKVIVATAGCYMLGMLVYAYIIDGFPFHADVITPCLITAVLDTYVHVVVFSVWIAYKESSWISAVFWILSLVCFSGMAICVYVVRELFSFSSDQQPVSLILFNKSSRDIMSSDPLLMEHSDV